MEINLLAVLVAAIAANVLGAYWYSNAGFGKQWMKLSGMSDADMKKAKQKGMGKEYGMNFLSSVVMAYVLAGLLGAVGNGSAGGALRLALVVWLGFIATLTLGNVLWEGKPWKLWVLNNAYWVLSLILMAQILTAF